MNANAYTLEQLACTVARHVRLFYNVCIMCSVHDSPDSQLSSVQDMVAIASMERAADWWLNHVPFERLYLIELRHAALGSWQPVLCYRPPGVNP